MEKLHSHEILFPVFLLLPFSSLLFLSSAYTRPEKYFINCGSNINTNIDSRKFVGDKNSGSLFSFSGAESIVVSNNNPKTNTSLYQTARVFKHPSLYKFKIDTDGTYLVRLHFYSFSSPANLAAAQFNVSASGFSLLVNFSVGNNSNSLVIKEFLFTINVGKFRIHFIPSQETYIAFVNAIEVFLAPESFIPDNAYHVTPAGSNGTYNGLLSQGLHTIHRINVGGLTLALDNDTLWRHWIPDDDYLLYRDSAMNSDFYSDKLEYIGNATTYTAPDLVYMTAKKLRTNFSNITWGLDVGKKASHLVRVHFCNIVSPSLYSSAFNLSIYSKFSKPINTYEIIGKLRAPFFLDFVVDSDASGFMNISVGLTSNSPDNIAFLNGLEIMVLMNSVPMQDEPKKKHLSLIVGSVVGGVALICFLIVVLVLGLKYRKAKFVETDAFPVPNLNLELKIPFAEIKRATNNFDRKKLIGEGGFGKVYRGTFRSGMKVAVKRSEQGHSQGLHEFQTEIMVLSKIRHRHLVSLIGYCDERNEMILVYEFMEKGTLREHLYNCNRISKRSFTQSILSWKQRLEICIGSAEGLNYLHTSSDGGIIHRDVKSTNILLDKHCVAKVGDFGISRSALLDQTHVSTDVKGSIGYLDPEYYRSQQLTKKSDVYSFGVVLLEVLCARPAVNPSLPREQMNLGEWGLSWHKRGQLEKIIDPRLVGDINPSSLRQFGATAEKCLKECGADRPTMGDVLWDLKYALELQQTAMHREPNEDSPTDASLEFPFPVVGQLPMQSCPVEEVDMPVEIADGSDTTASEVFSQLRIVDAR